ncbi:MAG: nicotinate phosphoribosyltransferase [Clostridiales bacterium]|nr:nicotinate phosphoribosyltransferase [Clostridiales bacterium]
MAVPNEEHPDLNLSLLCDFYELTMGNAYYANGLGERITYFDLYFRSLPEKGGYCIAAGLEQAVRYLQALRFTEQDIAFLRAKGIFDEGFLRYLADFRFCCDVWAVPEGTAVFPNEPLVTVRGPAIQTHLLETMLLLTINHQTLIATKASRIVRAAGGRTVMEFGSRRAQGYSSAIYGARAAYIAGCIGSACTLAEKLFGVPALGTMSHAWVQMFDSELEAFRTYARQYPDSATLLVDTYNVLESGLPNAIRAFQEEVLPRGFRPKGIRIDSGDIAYLSKQARRMLDEAGLNDCKITASNSLDEYIIRDTILQGAAVDNFGVGERLITARNEPVLGGVYKLVAVEEEGEIIPKIKVSENVSKITTPHFKRPYRLFDRRNGKAIADVLCVHDERINDKKPYLLFDPEYPWKRKRVSNFEARELLVQVFKRGKLCYDLPALEEIRAHCAASQDTLWDEVKRFENPHRYYVDLSRKLWETKQAMLEQSGAGTP